MGVFHRNRFLASPGWLIAAGVLLLLAAAVWLSTPSLVKADGPDLNLFLAQYPDVVNTDLNDCDVCHTGSPPDLNDYGEDYLAQGRTMAALTLIENIDSDGDGVVNKVEIDVAIEPGDNDETPDLTFIPLVGR